jgi:hypothetical protein
MTALEVLPDPARIAAAQRLRASLPVLVHLLSDDDAHQLIDPTEAPVARARPASWPDDAPGPGDRCIVIGGPLRGTLGRVVGYVRTAHRGALISLRTDAGRYSRVVAEWVQPEGHPVPDVPVTRRDLDSRGGFATGDLLRITGGPRMGDLVTYVRTCGQQKPGRRTFKVRRADGSLGTVLAHIVRAA